MKVEFDSLEEFVLEYSNFLESEIDLNYFEMYIGESNKILRYVMFYNRLPKKFLSTPKLQSLNNRIITAAHITYLVEVGKSFYAAKQNNRFHYVYLHAI